MAFENLTYDDVSLSTKGEMEVSIKNTALINALISNPQATLERLKSSVASIDLSQISIDDYGTVIIKNDDLLEKVKAYIVNPVRIAGNNCGCNVYN
ncbi:MAG: hypothetical protein V7K69_19100 [Nostoc sp.]|uniref:hypothetical protein n=1 Tax=Nostoc sp. TaxID=1180 RepID=UPI002FF74336